MKDPQGGGGAVDWSGEEVGVSLWVLVGFMREAFRVKKLT